ncbi:diguanylate cyclase [Candidatus Bipolaricaulota bacterium]|nr:diguanylate cyclase [Candidatus Bipolaricaulota bacterium]TFH11302.1 MAG: GGDEF domain-containing protein [Candidatus Atribacteria bacterium]
MEIEKEIQMDSGTRGEQRRGEQPGLITRLRSGLRYGTTLRSKLVVLVLTITLLVVGALFWFSLASLRTSIAAIYESRARSVAAVISKSIQEKDYILYYSDELDADIGRLLDQHEAVMGITVVGRSARGFLVVASTDPTIVGELTTEEEQIRFEMLSDVEVSRCRTGDETFLRAYHPIFFGADLIGVVLVDMSLQEQARYITSLSWKYGAASLVGFLVLGSLLYLALLSIITKPVGRIAQAMSAVAQRKYGVEVAVPFRRIAGTRQRDEVSHLIDGFNLMTKVIHSHEQELMKLVVLDELTGTYTLDHLRAELERELHKTRRYKHPTSLLIIELEGLEERTSEETDAVLVRSASFLVSNLRNVDVLFRIGAVRFASLLPETPPEGAAIAASRLRDQILDVINEVNFPVNLGIAHLGWEEDGAPAIDEVIDIISQPFDLLRE